MHQARLELGSQRIATGLKTCYVEGKERIYKLEGEDPELFKYFAGCLYRDNFVFTVSSKPAQDSRLLIKSARLYALGERLLAPRFKDVAIYNFRKSLCSLLSYFTSDTKDESKDLICDLLEIATNELPDLSSTEDPLKTFILALCIHCLDGLQRHQRFKKLISTNINLCQALIMKAGRRNMLIPTGQ